MSRPQKNIGLSLKNTDPVSRRPNLSMPYRKVIKKFDDVSAA